MTKKRKRKKPEKKDLSYGKWRGSNWLIDKGYNQAIDDYEKFLPSESEIEEILVETAKDISDTAERYGDYWYRLAKAIHKRIISNSDKTITKKDKG